MQLGKLSYINQFAMSTAVRHMTGIFSWDQDESNDWLEGCKRLSLKLCSNFYHSHRMVIVANLGLEKFLFYNEYSDTDTLVFCVQLQMPDTLRERN